MLRYADCVRIVLLGGIHMNILTLSLVAATAVVLNGCGISSTPVKALTGTGSDAMASAQRSALGLGDMAVQNSGDLPDLSVSGVLGVMGIATFAQTINGTISYADNLAGGAAGKIPYQSGAGTTLFSNAGANGQVLSFSAGVPTFVNQSTLSVGSATSATTAGTATHLAGGLANQIPMQTGPGATSFVNQSALSVGSATSATTAGTATHLAGGLANQIPMQTGPGATSFVNQSALSVGSATTAGTATHLALGTMGDLPVQSAAGTTTFIAPGTANYLLKSNGSGAIPSYVDPSTLAVQSSTNATNASHISGGSSWELLYQSNTSSTAFLPNGAAGNVLQATATAPTWVALSGLTVGTATTASTASTITFVTAPTAKTDACTTGQMAKDATYLYVCRGTGDWKRIVWDGSW